MDFISFFSLFFILLFFFWEGVSSFPLGVVGLVFFESSYILEIRTIRERRTTLREDTILINLHTHRIFRILNILSFTFSDFRFFIFFICTTIFINLHILIGFLDF